MAGKRKTTKKTETQEVAVAVNEAIEQPVGPDLGPAPEIEISTNIAPAEIETKKPKFKTGDIVFISKDADTDLNGFKLFPQYKKCMYTVEAYDEISDVYTLRRLNLSLRLPAHFILAPDERAHDPLHRRQF